MQALPRDMLALRFMPRMEQQAMLLRQWLQVLLIILRLQCKWVGQ
jgi:hypothetical protein